MQQTIRFGWIFFMDTEIWSFGCVYHVTYLEYLWKNGDVGHSHAEMVT